MANALDSFAESVGSVVRALRDPAAVVAAVEPLMAALVREPGWLEAKYRRPIPEKPYAQYLLYRPDDFAFSVVSFVWNPFRGSPIHDHGTWGVIGQYEGEEEEIRYRRVDDGSRPDTAVLEEVETVTARAGSVSHVYPPRRDIHRIFNRTAAPTISIHVYGGDIGSRQRHVFDLPSGAVRPFVSGYDRPEASG